METRDDLLAVMGLKRLVEKSRQPKRNSNASKLEKKSIEPANTDVKFDLRNHPSWDILSKLAENSIRLLNEKLSSNERTVQNPGENTEDWKKYRKYKSQYKKYKRRLMEKKQKSDKSQKCSCCSDKKTKKTKKS